MKINSISMTDRYIKSISVLKKTPRNTVCSLGFSSSKRIEALLTSNIYYIKVTKVHGRRITSYNIY
jgi:hypothetical protein